MLTYFAIFLTVIYIIKFFPPTGQNKLADDENYRDLSNLERKLQKHETFECELHAIAGQLRRLNNTGKDLLSQVGDGGTWCGS